MKTKIITLLALIVAFSSCKKQAPVLPFWNEQKKFEFQQTSYMYTQGSRVQIISLEAWNAQQPDLAVVKIYSGITGGQQSFSDTTAVNNFIYITDSVLYSGSYTANSIIVPAPSGNETIGTNITGDIQTTNPNFSFDYRKIASLTYQGKTFLPIKGSQFIARENEIGLALNQFITKDHTCTFTGCINGVSSDIQWHYNGTEVSIIGNSGFIMHGTVTGSRFSTPMLLTDNGEAYIIQFYTEAQDGNQMACTCTMSFKLYQVVTEKSSIYKQKFKLIIGDC